MGDVTQTYLPADSYKSQTARQTFISRFSYPDYCQTVLCITGICFLITPAEYHTAKCCSQESNQCPTVLIFFFLHDCRASIAACSKSSIWTTPCGRPKAVIAALFKLRQTLKKHFLMLCRLQGSHCGYNSPETLLLFWKECRTNLKRPGGQLPANSHLGNKNRVLMGTVSRNTVEPRAGNAGFTDSRGGRRKNEWFTGCTFFLYFSSRWRPAGGTEIRWCEGKIPVLQRGQKYLLMFCVVAQPKQNHQKVSHCYIDIYWFGAST